MNQSDDLRNCFRALAENSPRAAGASVRQQLLVRFRERRDTKRRRAYIAGIAASVVIAAGSYVGLSHRPGGMHRVPPAVDDQPSSFMTLPYAQSGVPLEQLVIVRVNIPVSELGLMGLAITPTGAKAQVRADLLVGQDGIARAVRIVE